MMQQNKLNKLVKGFLITLISSTLILGNFVFYSADSFKGLNELNIKTARAETKCDPNTTQCVNEDGTEKTQTTPEDKPKKKSQTPTTSTYKKADTAVKKAEDAKDTEIKTYDAAIAKQDKIIKDPQSTDQQKAAAQTAKINLENNKKDAIARHDAAIEKAKVPAQSKAQKAFDSAAKTTQSKQSTYDKKQGELDALTAERDAMLASKNPDQKAIDKLNKQITAKDKEVKAASKALGEAKTKQASAEKVLEKYSPKKEDTTKTNNEADGDVKGPEIDNPRSLDQFQVTKYLKAADDHNIYVDENGKSGAVNFILAAIDLLIKLIGSIALIIIIIGGLVLITSTGNEQQLDKGKDIIKYGIIGLVIALSSFLIITFINNFLAV